MTEPTAPARPPAGPLPPARSFAAVADAYDRGRPGYPRAAAEWLTSRAGSPTGTPLSVLELGAGTGKLTVELVALGHDVHATEPDPAMIAVLQRRFPDLRSSMTGAEEIPAAAGSYDVVVAAQCFHWFDLDRALPEMARVLRPGGHLALVWNQRDERIPWVRRLGHVIGTQDQLREPAAPLEASGLFGEVEARDVKHWQTVDRQTLHDLVLSRSNVATLGEAARRAKLDEALALYDDYGRGPDGLQLPYLARCYRAPLATSASPTASTHQADEDPDEVTKVPGLARNPDDSGMLLIDFR